LSTEIKLEESWKKVLAKEFAQPYMIDVKKFLRQEKNAKKIIYPKSSNIFKAFELTPIDKVRVVIIGQDPYHGQNQAHGLCFSVSPGVAIPPSLQNIYKELYADLNITPAQHGSLVHWAQQGVLLLNSVLTVEQGQAGSHQGKGWERFTDFVIEVLNACSKPIVFLLWGKYAKDKGVVISNKQHVILRAAHPSPFSAYKGFFGCKHFSTINKHLVQWGGEPIDWQLPEEV
jgi:uracil-DNA glycosylase